MGGHNTTSVQSSTGPVVPPPALKSKKSIDWLPKSFKRSKASGLATTAPLASSASSSQSRGSFRLSRNDFLSQKNSQTRSTDSSNSDSFLPVIPGSPRDTHSLTSTGSNDDPKSGDEICSLPSQPSPGLPLTPEDVPAVQVSNISLLSSSLPLRHSFPAHKSHETESPGLHTPTISSTSSDRHLDVPQDRPHGLAEKGTSDYEKLVLSLSSRKALRTMLDDPVGLWKFGQFLASEMNAETLVFWLNAEQHRNDLKRLYSLTQRIHSLHIPSNAPLALNITSAERAGIEKSIKSFVRADDPFKVARDAAFNALYHDAWPRFLQWRLELLHERMRNGDKVAPQTSFTLSDPSSERDQPLLLASDGFLELTGYSRDEVLMRNCRFLQGAGTSAATIARIRQACKYGQPLTELILNYRKDGVPFWSLFRLIPLRNANGKLKYLLGAQENVTNVLSATPDLAHLLADELDPCPMAPRPPFEHDLAETQMHDTGEAMRAYLKSLDRGTAPADKPIGLARPTNISPNPSQRSPLLNTGTPSPLLGPNNSAFASNATTPRPRSANRDMHLHAAAALAFDGTMGSNPARSAQSWAQAPVHGRPATSNSIFARPDTSYSMVDTQGREMAQLSLAEKTKAFNEASSHYLVLDSTCDMILFHSANLPATIKVGTAFPELVGATLAKRIKDKIAQSERVDIPLAPVRVPPIFDPLGVWREGVKLALTPLKDQINEVGAVIVLMSNTQGQKRT